MFHRLLRLARDDEAATAVEYAVMLALVLAVVIGAITTFGNQTGGLWSGIQGDLNATTFGNPSGP